MKPPSLAEPRVSRYLDAHAGEVARFLTECAARDPTLEGLSVESWRAFTRQSFNRGAKDFSVVRIQSRVVALLTSTLLSGSGLPIRHFRIIVHPDQRRQGIGTILLRRVEDQEPTDGVVLQCNCRDSWSAGREFLKRSGFEVTRRYLEMELHETRTPPSTLPAECAIRRDGGTAADDADWMRLDHEGYGDDLDAQQPTANDLEIRRREPGFRLWLMECEGATVGFLHAAAGARARIHSLVVSADCRSRGFGRGLMIHGICALRRDGAEAFTLGVRAENAPALGLYRGLGFEVAEETEAWQRTVRRAR